MSDLHTYPQLYERAARILRHQRDLPFLEPKERGKKKASSHTLEGITGDIAQVLIQQKQKGQGNPQSFLARNQPAQYQG